jgi:hypothetical protein
VLPVAVGGERPRGLGTACRGAVGVGWDSKNDSDAWWACGRSSIFWLLAAERIERKPGSKDILSIRIL